VIGIDGGGSGTSAVLATNEGRIEAVGSGGPANFQVVGEEQTVQSIVAAISSAVNQGTLCISRNPKSRSSPWAWRDCTRLPTRIV